jgi:hypothetical protein
MLKITRSIDPIQVKTIITTLYAQPGLGRTTMGYTAEDPILLDFDQAAHRAKNRKDTVLIQNWADVDKMDQADFAPYKTAVIDTVGRLLDHMTVSILNGEVKNGNRAGGLSLQGYGVLKTTFVAWLNKLRSFGLDVVLLAHMDEQKDGESKTERLDIQGGSKNEVYKVSDAMGRIYMENRKRILNFSPSDVAFGKNPGQLEPMEVPHFDKMSGFLAGIIKATKDAINKQTAEQMEVQALLADWKLKVDGAKKPEDFDALVPVSKEIDERVRENAKRILVTTARNLGIGFDKDKGVFVVVPGAEPAKEEPKKEEAKAAADKPAEEKTDETPKTPADMAKKATAKGKGKTKAAGAEQPELPTGGERVPGQEG